MGAALALASRGIGTTFPNPSVGCVIAKDGRMAGRSWTQPGGRPHAEAVALAQAGDAANGATAYVTLEPCAHVSPRGPSCADSLIAAGVARVVMGSAALKNPEFVREMAREWEGGIVVAVDAKDGMVATEGWAEVSDVPVTDLARRFEDAGVAALLFTDIGRDGLLKGVNIEVTVDLARRVDIPVIASGGVKGLDDIHILALHAHEGIEGVITGRALYEGRLDLAAAIAMGARAG